MDSSTKKAPKPQPRTANPRSQDRDSPQGKVYTAKTPNGPVQYTLVDSGSRPAPMNSKVQQQTPSAGMQDQGYSRGMPRSNSPAFANNPSPNSTISSPGMQDRGYSQRMFYAPGFTSPSHGTQNREHSQGMSYANSAGIVASRSHNFMSTGPGIPNREYPQGMPYTNFPGHVINRSHEFMINRSHEFMSTGPGMQNRDYLPGVPYTNFSGPVINRSRNFTMTNSEAPDQRDSRGIFPTPALTSTSYETQDRGFPQGMSHTSSPGFRSNRPPNFTLSSSCTQDRGYSSVDSLQFTSNRFPDFQSTIPQNTTYNASSLQQISMPINQRRRVGNASASTRDDRMATNSHLNKAFSTHGFNTTKILPPTQTLNLGKVFPQFFAPDPDSMDATKQKRTQGNSFRSSSEYSLSSEPSTSDMEVRDNLMPERVRAGQSTITSAAMNPNLARSTISSMSATPSAISQMTTSVVARSTSRLTRTAGPTNSTANANTPTHVQGTPRFAPSGPSHSNGMGRGGATTPFQTVARFDRPIASDSFEFRTPAQSHPYPIPHMSIPHLSTPLNKNPTQFTGGRRALDATNHMLRRENHSGPDQYLDPTMNIANVANINNREKCGPLPTSRNSDHTPPLIPNSHLTYELFPKFPIELREAIIQMAAKDSIPRTVSVSVIPENQKHRLTGVCLRHLFDSDLLRSKSLTPPLMRTSRETRAFASKIYIRVAGERYGESSIWFNFHADTLHIADFHTWQVMFGSRINMGPTCASPLMESMISNLRYLTIGVPFRNDTRLDVQILKQFPKLRVLTFQKSLTTMEDTMSSCIFNNLQERRTLEDGYERVFMENLIKGDYKGRGEHEKPVVLWRKPATLNKIVERYKNGIPTQAPAPKPRPEPLRFSQEWFNRVYDW